MGDRGNIIFFEQIDDQVGTVYLYTHWLGYEMPRIVQKALKRKIHWDDSAYLARTVFDELVGRNQGSDGGFGISAFMQDNEHPLLLIDVANQLIGVVEAPDSPTELPKVKPENLFTFDAFVALDLSSEGCAASLPQFYK